MKLYIVNRSADRVPRKFLEQWVLGLGREARREVEPELYRRRELGLIFLKKPDARRLNKKYRGKDYATDILSFEGDAEQTLGELVICPEVLRHQAEEHGLTFREELGYMVIHGFLHLLGFEHERGGREAERMFALQDRVFERLCKRLIHRQ